MICFVAATAKDNRDFLKTPLFHFLDHTNARYRVATNNQMGLGAIYNHFINQLMEECGGGWRIGPSGWEIVVFVHDDVDIQDLYYESKLREALEMYDVVGLAGTGTFETGDYTSWHVSPKSEHSGAVAHPYPPGSAGQFTAMSTYGPMPMRCVVLDGLFLAVRLETLRDHPQVRFDTQFKFHHYDLDFCLTADKAGLKVGTWPIWAVHQSPGLFSWDGPDWPESRDRFNRKWGYGNVYVPG